MPRFVREKKIKAGRYLDVEIYTYSTEQVRRLPRYKRKKVTPPKIIAENNRNAVKKFIALVNTNFSDGGYRFDVTYEGEAPTPEQAEKCKRKLIYKLKKLYSSHGAAFRYIIVTEGGRDKGDGTYSRIHHHLIVGNEVSRDEVESCWQFGRRSCAHLQINRNEHGLEPLARYLMKHRRGDDEKGKCRWSGSRNLKKPTETVNDNCFTLGEQERLLRAEADGTLRAKLEKRYKGYDVINCAITPNPVTGFLGVSVQLHRRN